MLVAHHLCHVKTRSGSKLLCCATRKVVLPNVALYVVLERPRPFADEVGHHSRMFRLI